MNITDKIQQEISKNMEDAIAAEMLAYAQAEVRPDGQFKTLSDSKADIDPEYLHSIKSKVEKILGQIIDKYELNDYLSENYRCRIDPAKMVDSKYYKLYMECKDIDGQKLKYGHEHIPENFEEWKEIYLKDYVTAEIIYNEMCGTKRVQKGDLVILNSLAKKYKVLPK